MWRKNWMVFLVVVSLAAAGCGKASKPSSSVNLDKTGNSQASDPSQEAATGEDTREPPAIVAEEFLKAMCGGDGEKVSQLLTVKARSCRVASNLAVADDSARISVDNVKYLTEDIAHVECKWTNLDGETRAICALRKESDTWRIAGVAPYFFEDADPVLLDFEKPEELAEKLIWLQQEKLRREQGQEFQAQKPKNSAEPMQR